MTVVFQLAERHWIAWLTMRMHVLGARGIDEAAFFWLLLF